VSVKDNLEKVKQQIIQAAFQSGRTPEEIQLIAVSKTKSVELIKEALSAKQTAFGENRIQEALGKIEVLKNSPEVEWHLIGHLQKNKAKFCPGYFQWIHSVESIELAKILEARCDLTNKNINVLIQVNLSREESKSGLQEWDEILRVAEYISSGRWLKFRGLMTIPAPNLGEFRTRKIFEQIREWRDKLRDELDSPGITELSMGMTADYNWAIQEGATMIRVGTAIFGSREQQ